MKLYVYNQKESKFDQQVFATPNFIKDESIDVFAGMVQAEHLQSISSVLSDKYSNAYDKAMKSSTPDNLKALQDAEEASAKFHKACNELFPDDKDDEGNDVPNDVWTISADVVSQLFCVAFGLEKGTVNIDSYKSFLYDDTRAYEQLFYTMKDWTQARKDAFKALKDKSSEYVNLLFSLTSETDVYVKRTFSMNSKDTQMYIDKAAPTLKKTKVKDSFGDVTGIAETQGSAKACFTFLLQVVFYHHGCAVTKPEKKKARLYF